MILVKRDRRPKAVLVGKSVFRDEVVHHDGQLLVSKLQLWTTKIVMYEVIQQCRAVDGEERCAVLICRRRCCKDRLVVVEDATVCARCAGLLRLWIRLRDCAETLCRFLERRAGAEKNLRLPGRRV